MKLETNVKAGARTCHMASPAAAKALCKSGRMGRWDIATIVGKPGMAQYGPGYGCKQGIEKKSGIGDAVCA